MNIGQTLKKLRKSKGLSQQDLAERANLSRSYISEIENGACNLTVETIENIGKVLCIPGPIIAFLSLDINSIPENKRDDYRKIEPTILSMIEECFLDEVEC